ncbi:MAG TPA: OmpA family protein [Gemmatimonadales bacterium]
MGNGFVCPATCRRFLALLALGVLAACGNGSQSDALPFHAAPAQHFVFTNGDFENDPIGTMPPSGWTLLNYLDANGVSGTASAPPSSFSALNLSGLGTGVNETFVVGGTTLTQADPDLGAGQTFRFPLYGQRSARLNYKDATTNGKNKNANVLRQSMTVSLADVDPTDGQIHVRFAIAPVLENPSHSFNQQPYFYVELLDLTRGTTLYTGFNTAGQTGVPWHTTTSIATGNATQWLDWALVDISPGNTALSVGDQVQLTVVASGCSLGGHFGRVYLDGMGSTVPGPYVSATAPQSVNAGATLTYTYRYANGGSTAALGAHVDQVTPPNTTFASVSGITGCTTPAAGNAGTISCPIGTLNPGASGSFTITVNVAASATGKIINGNYSIGSVNQPTLLGAKVTTAVIGSTTHTADIVVVKTASVTAVQPGAAFTSGANNPLYTITITNNSTTDQIRASLGRSVSFTDVIPSQLTGVTWACTVTRAGSGTGANPTKCRDQGGAANFNGTGNSISLSPRLGFNSGAGGGQLTIKVFGTISATASGTMVNTAATSAPSGTTDPDLTNNTSTVSVFVGTPRTLTVTKAGGNANGSVNSAPAGLSCGTSCGSASGTFADGSQVVLSASPVAGASFTGWSGAVPASCTTSPAPLSCTLTISGNMNVTATFAPPPAVSAATAVFVYSGNNQLTSTGTAFGSPLAVLVADANGTPVQNTAVSFAAVPSAGSASAGLGTGAATTNASGIATLTATANSTPGTYTVNATVSGVPSPATFTLTNVGPPASITYVNGGSSTDPQMAPINTQYAAPLVAVVRDAASNPIPGATVTYIAQPASGASCTVSNGSSSGASVTATTDSSGMSSVTATANGTVGAFTVTASVSGVATPATFRLQNVSTGPAAVFIVSGNPQTAPTGSAFASPLVVVVADASGNSLPGITVNFAAQTGSSGATATLSAATAVTDSSGLASVTATANATGGVFTVTASVSGVSTPATFTLTNDGGQTIQVQAGSPQSATVGAAFGSQLQALVLDGTGAAVAGAVVTFQAPASGATATLSGGSACLPAAAGCMTATTNASGIASVNATANSIAGQYAVTASTPNAPTAASFDLTNQCTADSQCTGMTPICNSTTLSCVACATNTQCSNKNPAQPWCDVSGSCFACIADSQCSGATPICSQATNSCAACTTDAQCGNKDPANPYCLPSGTCFAGYTITPSAGANGTVSPSGAQTVGPGGTLAISIAPAAHYHVADVLVDGSSVGAVTSFTFTNVSANHTLVASFAIDQFAVTASSGPNGTLSCSSPVDYGQSSTCTITPAVGYQLAKLTDNLVDVTSQVVAGSYLATNVIAPRSIAATFIKSQGTSCGGAGECATGHCVDGFCCDTACNGQCQACDAAGGQGTCTTIAGAPRGARTACASDGTVCGGRCDGAHPAACTYPSDSISCRGPSCAGGTATLGASCDGAGACPAVQTQTCAPFTCGPTACNGNCNADSDCTAGNWCSGGVCAPLLAQGQACGGGNQCGSQHCVDGVCCNTSCTGQCEACAEAGSAGTCTPVAGAPRNARTACVSDGSVCGGACDGTQPAACAYPGNGTTCRAPSCSSGVAVQAASCNGAGSCPAEQDVSCSPFTCGPNACAGNCTVDSDCVAGNYCAAGICTPRSAPGVACGGANQCASGQCVDGVCCATACNGQCQACDVPGSAGTCTNVIGAPHGARQACASDGSACAGVCDGSSATACAYPAAICRGSSCSAGVATLQAACDGAGRCPARQTQGCNLYLCGPQACLGNCGSDADCVSGNFCAAGICKPLLANGGACAGANQCASGQCVDGVCCNAACGGQCQACDAPGQVGTCTTVVGAPHGSRQACASDGSACGGACDGSNATQCAYPGSAVECRALTCSDGVITEAATCSGSGACPAKVQDSCGGAICNGTACATTACNSDAQCATTASCVAGQCQPKGKAGVWLVAGSGGCASGGGASLAPLLALALMGLWRVFRPRTARRRAAALARNAALAAALAASAVARAQTVPVQPQFDADRFNPGAGSTDILSVGSASVPEHLDVHVSIFSSYARDPLRLIAVGDPTQQIRLLHSQTLMHLGASMALFGRFELGLTLPVLVAQSASSNDLLGTVIAPGEGIGDVRLVPKAQLWRSEILAIAVAAPVTLPTGSGDAFLSHGSVTLTPELRVESNALPVRVAASSGIVLRRGREFANLAVGNALTYGLAGELPFSWGGQRLAALATLAGEVELQQSGAVERPMELLAAVRWLLPANLMFTFGGGPGLTNGYGTPRYRVFAGIGFDPAQAVRRSRPRPPPLVQDFPRPALALVPPPVEPEAPLPVPVAVAEAEPAPPVPPMVLPLPVAAVVLAAAPTPALQRVVRNGHLALLAQVQFAHDAATILPVSLPLLDQVVAVLRDTPEIRKVRIEGHTDGRGKPAYNRRLSQRRAESVLRHLVAAGIGASRLRAKGFGPDRPIVPNNTGANRAKNRRVEFVVLDGPKPDAAQP